MRYGGCFFCPDGWFAISKASDGACVPGSTGYLSVGDRYAVGRLYGRTAGVDARDFDGDGRADKVLYTPVSGHWVVLKSSNSAVAATDWGDLTDRLVPGDYDGDKKTDLAVFRESTGMWHIRASSQGVLSDSFDVTRGIVARAD